MSYFDGLLEKCRALVERITSEASGGMEPERVVITPGAGGEPESGAFESMAKNGFTDENISQTRERDMYERLEKAGAVVKMSGGSGGGQGYIITPAQSAGNAGSTMAEISDFFEKDARRYSGR